MSPYEYSTNLNNNNNNHQNDSNNTSNITYPVGSQTSQPNDHMSFENNQPGYSKNNNRMDYYQQQQQQQQQQQYMQNGGTTTSQYASDAASLMSGTSSSSRSRYRQDYSRSQHLVAQQQQQQQQQQAYTSPPSSANNSMEMSPEKQRFEAYINRFAAHDPRASPIRHRSRTRPPYTEPPQPRPTTPTASLVADRAQRFGGGIVGGYNPQRRQQQPPPQDSHMMMMGLNQQPPPSSSPDNNNKNNNNSDRFPTYPDPELELKSHESSSTEYGLQRQQPQPQQNHLYLQQQLLRGSPLSFGSSSQHQSGSSSAEYYQPQQQQQQQVLRQNSSSSSSAVSRARSMFESQAASRASPVPFGHKSTPSYNNNNQHLQEQQQQLQYRAVTGDSSMSGGRRTPVGVRYRPQPQQQQQQPPPQQQQFPPVQRRAPSPHLAGQPSPIITTTMQHQGNNSYLQQQQQPLPQYDTMENYSQATIETPSPARVTDLKKQLWDHDETLQVTVPPSLHYAQAKQQQQQQQPPPPLQATTPDRYGSRRGRAVDAVVSGPEMAGRHGQRLARSLSPDRPQYRNFKSKFYEAALASRRMTRYADLAHRRSTTPPRADQAPQQGNHYNNHHHEPVAGEETQEEEQDASPSKFQSRYVASSLRRTNRLSNPDNVVPSRSNVWRHEPPTTEAELLSGGEGDATVARLVAKLNAVKRDNPAMALAKIDSILRAESRSSSERSRDSREVGNSPTPPNRALNDSMEVPTAYHDDDDEEDGDSDEETSVSSITNPTYQSVKAPSVEFDGGVSPSNRRGRRPNALENYAKKVQSPSEVEESLSKAKTKKRTPPPSSIKVNSVKDSQNRDTLKKELLKSKTSSMNGKSAAEIALKIRMWDQMTSGNGLVTSKGFPNTMEEDTTAGTSELGSIMTPADAAAAAGGKQEKPIVVAEQQQREEAVSSNERAAAAVVYQDKIHVETQQDAPVPRATSPAMGASVRRNHPWDRHHPRNRSKDSPRIVDTSMEGGMGLEIRTQPNENPKVLKIRQEAARRAQYDVAADTSGFTGDSFDIDPKLLLADDDDDEFGAPKGVKSELLSQSVLSSSQDFDAAWVPLPPSAFFNEADGNARQQQKAQRDRSQQQQQQGSRSSSSPNQKAIKRHNRVSPSPNGRRASSSSSLPRVAMPPIPREFPTPEPEPDRAERSKSPARRKFNLKPILKRRSNGKKADPLVQSIEDRDEARPRTSMPAYAMEPVDVRAAAASSSSALARSRSKSHSPGRRRFNDGAPRNSNLAKKFSRLMRVYDNE